MQQAAEKYDKEIEGIEPEAQQVLMAYSWPGNVRQLRNVDREHGGAVARRTGTRRHRSLPPEIRPAGGASRWPVAA